MLGRGMGRMTGLRDARSLHMTGDGERRYDGPWGAEARRAVGSRGTTGGGEPRHDGRWGAEARRAVTHGIVSSSVVTHAPVFSSFTAVFFGFMSHRFVHSSRWCRDPVVPWYVGEYVFVYDDVSVGEYDCPAPPWCPSPTAPHDRIFSSFGSFFFGFMSRRFSRSARWCGGPVD